MTKRKRTKNKQRSTKHTHKTKDRVKQTPLKTKTKSLFWSFRRILLDKSLKLESNPFIRK